MSFPIEQLFRVLFLLYKIQRARNKRRRRETFSRRKALFQRTTSLCNMRRTYSKFSHEKMLYINLLSTWAQTNTFRSDQRYFPANWWEETVKKKFKLFQWRKYFRMSKKTFTLLVEKLEPHLQSSNLCKEITHEKKVAITLLSFATGKSKAVISRVFSVKKWEVSHVIRTITNVILHVLMPEYLKTPSENTLIKYLEYFETKWSFPQCAGVLESMHIPINGAKLPENATDYVNTDNGYSMYLQGVVDPMYKFWDINVGWPGSVTESRVFTSSTLWKKGQEKKLFPDWTKNIHGVKVPIYILAGSSYPLADWVLKPIQQTDSLKQCDIKFNEKFAFARKISEIGFKRLKARWNCLVTGNVCSIDIFPNVVAACCVLHNICETFKEPTDDKWIVKSEKCYQQPLPSSCSSVLGSDAENIQHALKLHFEN